MAEAYTWTTGERKSIKDDLFGHPKVLEPLVDRIATAETNRLYAIFAPWGCGKSTALNFCEEIHDAKAGSSAEGGGRPDKSLWLDRFETWKYEDTDDLVVAMLWHIERSLRASGLPKDDGKKKEAGKRLRRLGAAVAIAAAKVASKAILKTDVVEEAGNVLKLVDETQAVEGKISSSSAYLQCEFRVAIEAEFEAIGESLLEGQEEFDRIVVPVDDMDRCRPEAAIRLLFALKNLLACKHFVFLVAIDREALARFLAYTYQRAIEQSEAVWFLEKVFDDWAELPPPRARAIVRIMAEQGELSPTNSEAVRRLYEDSGLVDVSVNARRFLRAAERYKRTQEGNLSELPALDTREDKSALGAAVRLALCVWYAEYTDEFDAFLRTAPEKGKGPDYTAGFQSCFNVVIQWRLYRLGKSSGKGQYEDVLVRVPAGLVALVRNTSSGLSKTLRGIVECTTDQRSEKHPSFEELGAFVAVCLKDVLPCL